jgi:hypothetical protein
VIETCGEFSPEYGQYLPAFAPPTAWRCGSLLMLGIRDA